MGRLKDSKERAFDRKKVQIHSEKVHRDIWKANKIIPEPVLGTKATIMMIYAQKGKLAAWQALQEYNQKLSGVEYTLEMLEKWIEEESRRRKVPGKAKDDDDAR